MASFEEHNRTGEAQGTAAAAAAAAAETAEATQATAGAATAAAATATAATTAAATQEAADGRCLQLLEFSRALQALYDAASGSKP